MRGFFAQPEVGEDALDGADLLIAIRVARIDDVDEEVRVLHLLERRAKRRDQLFGELANEADGVGDDHLALVGKPQATADRIERREQFVSRERVALGHRVEQRRLARIGVAADRDDRQIATLAPAAAQPAIVGELGEATLEQRDPIARAATIDLELGLAGTATADATGEPRHHRVLLDQPRQRVAQLRELDLELAVAARGVLREDIEDQHRAIEDLELGRLGDRPRLPGRQIGIEDHDLGAELHRAQQDLVELAAPDEEFRITLGPALDEHVEHLDARGAAQLAELGDPRLGIGRATELDVNEQRAVFADIGGGDTVRATELLLELGDQVEEVGLRRGRLLDGQLDRGTVRHHVADVQLAGPTRCIDTDRGDRIEPQQREVGHVVARERLVAQMGMNEPQAAKPAGATADTTEIGQRDLRSIADHDVLDRTAAIDQHTDLAMELGGLQRELLGKLARHDLGRCDAAAIQALQRLDLACLQTLRIARYLFLHAGKIYPLRGFAP